MQAPRDSVVRYVQARAFVRDLAFRLRNQAGEGVISAAIVVLIMAIIGAGMCVVFNRVFQNASSNIEAEGGRIGG
jgi:hypothetical protein